MFKEGYRRLSRSAEALQPFFLLIIRLFWGWQFFMAGLGKWIHFAKTVGFFQTLPLPFPLLSVTLAATAETLGGLLILMGLFTRLAAIPLSITMTVALLAAHTTLSTIFTAPSELFKLSPFSFLIVSLTLFCFGPGRYSLDAILDRHSSSRTFL